MSDLPPGSGMGGSSVLAAAILRCLSDLLGVPHSSPDRLISQVSEVEQILTSGGGWQDQVLLSYFLSVFLKLCLSDKGIKFVFRTHHWCVVFSNVFLCAQYLSFISIGWCNIWRV